MPVVAQLYASSSNPVAHKSDVSCQTVPHQALLWPAAVLGFTEVMADSSNLGHFTLGLHDMGRYMRLDAAAQRALNVMKSRADANDAFSLYGLMNRCKTVMGKRLLKVSAAPFTPVRLINCIRCAAEHATDSSLHKVDAQNINGTAVLTEVCICCFCGWTGQDIH